MTKVYTHDSHCHHMASVTIIGAPFKFKTPSIFYCIWPAKTPINKCARLGIIQINESSVTLLKFMDNTLPSSPWGKLLVNLLVHLLK